MKLYQYHPYLPDLSRLKGIKHVLLVGQQLQPSMGLRSHARGNCSVQSTLWQLRDPTCLVLSPKQQSYTVYNISKDDRRGFLGLPARLGNPIIGALVILVKESLRNSRRCDFLPTQTSTHVVPSANPGFLPTQTTTNDAMPATLKNIWKQKKPRRDDTQSNSHTTPADNQAEVLKNKNERIAWIEQKEEEKNQKQREQDKQGKK
ncbi:hypothetical protein M8818_004196 [Zalaria obscura]|uniref:Uncharacterized protein n=1 Tax=Zalaria obscura TaxID=2024903 RepID=A0ACC3SEC9_9PEZI